MKSSWYYFLLLTSICFSEHIFKGAIEDVNENNNNKINEKTIVYNTLFNNFFTEDLESHSRKFNGLN